MQSIPQAAESRKYTPTTRRVLWFLLSSLRRKEAWQTYVSVPQHVIADRLGISRRSVIRAMHTLQADGVLCRTHQPLPDGGRKPDLIDVDRQAVSSVVHGRTCHIRKRPKCHIRSTSLPVGKDPIAPASVATGTATTTKGEPMQGELFAGNRTGKVKPSTADNARTRLQTFQTAYRARYGRKALIPNIGAAMKALKSWQAGPVPSPAVWAAVVDVYLRESDRALVEAAHPLSWLSRRLPALLPRAEAQAKAEAAIATVNAQNAAREAALTDEQRRQIQYPGIRPGEAIDAWKVRIKAARAKRDAEGMRKWA